MADVKTGMEAIYGTLVPTGGGDPIPLRKQDLMVGRAESCDIVLRFPNVSTRHCQLQLKEGYWVITDLDSRNGTKVGGERISRKRIDPGQRVSIAKHDYTLEYSPVDNGAVGPPVIEDEVDQFMNASLLQRANLQRKVSFEEAKRSGVKKPTPPTPQPKPGQKRWS
ncbi:MAG: protein FhaB [Planctomycetota bacterium]|jgi:adenylate cyclase